MNVSVRLIAHVFVLVDTKLALNLHKPPSKMSTVDRTLNVWVLVIFVVLACLVLLLAMGSIIWDVRSLPRFSVRGLLLLTSSTWHTERRSGADVVCGQPLQRRGLLHQKRGDLSYPPLQLCAHLALGDDRAHQGGPVQVHEYVPP